MLQNIRDWVSGWLAIVIVAALIVPFAFWGINYYFNQGGEVIALKVNGKSVTLRDFQQAYQIVRQRWQQTRGDAAVPDEDAMLKQRTLDALIERELLQQFDVKYGLRVSDEQVRQVIDGFDIFRGPTGAFDPQLYRSNLANLGYTPKGFEARIRMDMLADQLQNGLTSTSFVTDAEAKRIAVLDAQTRDITWFILPSNPVKEKIQITEDDIKKYYDAESKLFQEPEKVKIAYIQLSQERIADDVQVTDDQLHAYYDANKQNYGQPEQRQVDQLLVNVPENSTDEQVTAAHDEAEKLAAEARSGKPLKEIAESLKSGGSTPADYTEFGFLTRDVLEKEVEEVAFKLPENGVGGPVRSKYGFHVLHVGKIRGGTIPPFDEVHDRVAHDYKMSEAQKRYLDLGDRLGTLTFEHPESLQVAADDLGLTVQQSEFFSRDNTEGELTGNPKVIDAAFSDEVLQNGNNSDVIEIDDTHAVVLRVVDHVAEHKKPLDEVRESIATRLRYERARDEVQKNGEAIIAKLRQGTARDAIASEYKVEWQEAAAATRDDPKVNRAVLRAAFRSGRPKAGASVYDGVSLGSGDYAVIGVLAVNDPAPDSIPEDRLNTVHEQMAKGTEAIVWAQFTADLRKRAKIDILSENL